MHYQMVTASHHPLGRVAAARGPDRRVGQFAPRRAMLSELERLQRQGSGEVATSVGAEAGHRMVPRTEVVSRPGSAQV